MHPETPSIIKSDPKVLLNNLNANLKKLGTLKKNLERNLVECESICNSIKHSIGEIDGSIRGAAK